MAKGNNIEECVPVINKHKVLRGLYNEVNSEITMPLRYVNVKF
jgi:hypothetical protein